MKRQPNYSRYGLPGSRIPGSRYFRGYCRVCGDPIRVQTDCPRKAMTTECADCFDAARNERGRQRASR